jgi:hypothetical protein
MNEDVLITVVLCAEVGVIGIVGGAAAIRAARQAKVFEQTEEKAKESQLVEDRATGLPRDAPRRLNL